MTRPDPDNKENDTAELIVSEADEGIRLDKWLSDQFELISRSRIKALIEGGHVQRDNVVLTDGATKIKTGEAYGLTIPPIEEPLPTPENIPLNVLYEDDHLIVVNKPAGMVVHPAAGNFTGTLVNALLYHCGASLSGIGGVARPGIVHRLDKDTSGIMVAAKHDEAHQGLTAAFSVHDINRVYKAIVHGAPRPGIGTISTGIARASSDRKKMAAVNLQSHHQAKNAVTHYRAVETFGKGRAKMPGDSLASLIECQLETGRTHQIRVHMAHIGHPLIGDQAYGRGPGLAGLRPGDSASDEAISFLQRFRRQALHASRLGFGHPVTGQILDFSIGPPDDFLTLQNLLGAL